MSKRHHVYCAVILVFMGCQLLAKSVIDSSNRRHTIYVAMQCRNDLWKISEVESEYCLRKGIFTTRWDLLRSFARQDLPTVCPLHKQPYRLEAWTDPPSVQREFDYQPTANMSDLSNWTFHFRVKCDGSIEHVRQVGKAPDYKMELHGTACG